MCASSTAFLSRLAVPLCTQVASFGVFFGGTDWSLLFWKHKTHLQHLGGPGNTFIVLLHSEMLVWLYKSEVCSQFSFLFWRRWECWGVHVYILSTDHSWRLLSVQAVVWTVIEVYYLVLFNKSVSQLSSFPCFGEHTTAWVSASFLGTWFDCLHLWPCSSWLVCSSAFFFLSFFLCLQVVQDWPPVVQPEQGKCKPESYVETAFASNAIPACFSRELLMRCFIHTKSALLCSLPFLIVLDECRRSSAGLESS